MKVYPAQWRKHGVGPDSTYRYWILETLPVSMLMVRFWGAVCENRVVPSQSPGRELQLAWRQPLYTEHGEGWGDAMATCQTHQGGL